MNTKAKKIGIVIADDQEYIPFENYFEKYGVSKVSVGGFEGCSFDIEGVTVVALLCGIGKVNATCAATTLIHVEHCDVILNEGLSGGLQVERACFLVSERFVEHDFDLTPIGKPLAVKPGEELFKYPDADLLALADEITCAKLSRGTFGSGDSFISDPNKTAIFINEFNETACDMESAAIASVCGRNNIPFLSIRKISDNANEDSKEDYNNMNDKQEADLSVVIEEFITLIAKKEV